jgi:predicted secreted hydrolase
MFKFISPSLMLLPLLVGCRPDSSRTQPDLSELFSAGSESDSQSEEENWSKAIAQRELRFPSDHGAHTDYRIEWWYYVGNLQTKSGRRFGYQLTFFRTGLRKEPTNPSRWAVRDLYTAHFAVSDIQAQQHHCFQRNNRRGIDYAGAASERLEVWNGSWRAWMEGETHRLQATEGDVSIDLTLVSSKPPILHGEAGLSKKGSAIGNASYYYSLTRLTSSGTIHLGKETFKLEGSSWMDHEFSTSFLEPGQLGWDWLAIQLDNGDDLMLYRMRRDDGSADPYSSGSLVRRNGEIVKLSLFDYKMSPTSRWQSPKTGADYPTGWKIEIPSCGYELEIETAFPDQEMNTSSTTGISYWEGSISVRGTGPDGQLAGRGYMELTGYSGVGLGSLFNRAD